MAESGRFVSAAVPPAFSECLTALVARRDLADGQVRAALDAIADGVWGEAEVAAFLVGLRAKGETAAELAAAAAVARERMIRLDAGPGVLDTCGTGGGAARTLNISTAAAFVVAGAGARVVKHGNRAVTGRSGSADVLAHLGIEPEADADLAGHCLRVAGLAFCFAPRFHPAWRHVAPVRRRLGIRTLFNAIGPLANPAGAEFQLLGVGDPQMLDPVAGALARLGTRHALVVWAEDGLDEVSLAAPTHVREVRGDRVTVHVWRPGDFGLGNVAASALTVSGAGESAERIRAVLDGRDSPAARVVMANAAAALVAADAVGDVPEGVTRSRAAVESGAARRALEIVARCCRHEPAVG